MRTQIIEDALDEVRAAIYTDQYPEVAGLESQLMRAESVLMEMISDMERGQKLSDQGGLGHMVVDQWPLASRVSEAVCAAVREYEKIRLRST